MVGEKPIEVLQAGHFFTHLYHCVVAILELPLPTRPNFPRSFGQKQARVTKENRRQDVARSRLDKWGVIVYTY